MPSVASPREAPLAAISGHAVAGGCVLALTADHRILRRGAQIGLDEVRVGVPCPGPWPCSSARACPAPPSRAVALLGAELHGRRGREPGPRARGPGGLGLRGACLARLDESPTRTRRPSASPRATCGVRPRPDARAGRRAPRRFPRGLVLPESRERIRPRSTRSRRRSSDHPHFIRRRHAHSLAATRRLLLASQGGEAIDLLETRLLSAGGERHWVACAYATIGRSPIGKGPPFTA